MLDPRIKSVACGTAIEHQHGAKVGGLAAGRGRGSCCSGWVVLGGGLEGWRAWRRAHGKVQARTDAAAARLTTDNLQRNAERIANFLASPHQQASVAWLDWPTRALNTVPNTVKNRAKTTELATNHLVQAFGYYSKMRKPFQSLGFW